MKVPLLLNAELFGDVEEEKVAPLTGKKLGEMTPKRFTPMNLSNKSGSKSKGNALKIGTFDKFNSGMKDTLLKD